jgi:hypothetical protein
MDGKGGVKLFKANHKNQHMYFLHPLVISHKSKVSKIMNLIMINDMSCITDEEFKQHVILFLKI